MRERGKIPPAASDSFLVWRLGLQAASEEKLAPPLPAPSQLPH